MKSSALRAIWPLLALCLGGVLTVLQSQASRAADPPGLIPARNVPALLGDDLRMLAARHSRTSAEMAEILREQQDLYMSPRGNLVYSCATLAHRGQAAPSGQSPTGVPPFPVGDTFKLHSRPSATKKIFLDFDGHVTTGTWWNDDFGVPTINSTPFDTDGNPAGFGNGEHEQIQRAWQRIAEDFMPFEVDVTTEDPGVNNLRRSAGGDQNYGMRVVISPTDAWSPGIGGIAYLSVFDDIIANSNELPCFVFSDNVGEVISGINLAGTHEVGHTIGLNHDGTSSAGYYDGGATGDWGPIMGAPYGKNIVQWSKGEYPDANNPENDYIVAQSNSLFFRADDHADTPAAATLIGGNSPSANGVIQGITDKDVFRLGTDAGSVTVTTNPGPSSPNLDIQLDLLDGNGQLVQSFDLGGLGSSFTTNLPSGVFFIRLDGVGAGNPNAEGGYSDYGSLGEYTITGNLRGTGIALNLVSPNGGNSLSVGSNQNITWNSFLIFTNVKLELSTNGGNTWSTIAASIANDGSEPWVVPNLPTTQGRVRVSSVDGGVSDTSNNNFTITAAVGDSFEVDDDANSASTLNVGAPQSHTIHVPGDEDWAQITLFERSNVTLTTDGAAGDTVMELYGPDDSDELLDQDDDGGAGSFSQITRTGSGALAAGDYWVRVRDKSAAGTIAGYTLSLATSPGASINLIAPNGGQNWLAGSSQVIIWTSFGVTGNVKLEWFDGATWWLITDNTADDGSHLWTVPTVSTPLARVRVTPLNDPVAQDTSENAFTIFAAPTPDLQVTFPGGGESLPGGLNTEIEWDSSNVEGNVRIEYSLNGGKNWTALALSSSNDGVEPWTVPNTPTSQALVRVAAVNGSVADESDNFFFIPGPAGDEFEEDDEVADAVDIASGETQTNRSIHLPGNADWVRITLTSKRKIVLTTSGGTAGGDTVVTLYRSNGTTAIASNDNFTPGSGYSQVTSGKLAPGTYFAKVVGKGSSTIASYRLNLVLKK